MVPAAKKRKQIQSMKHMQDSSDYLQGQSLCHTWKPASQHKTWRNNWVPVMGRVVYTFLGLRAGCLQYKLAVVISSVSFQKQLRKKVFPGNFCGRRKSCHALLCLWQCGSNQRSLHTLNAFCPGHPQVQASGVCTAFQSQIP